MIKMLWYETEQAKQHAQELRAWKNLSIANKLRIILRVKHVEITIKKVCDVEKNHA